MDTVIDSLMEYVNKNPSRREGLLFAAANFKCNPNEK